MLTPEERQRIEAEERKKIAEEQYRAEVRSKLGAERPSKRTNYPLWLLGIGGSLIVLGFIWANSGKSTSGQDDAHVAQAASTPARMPVQKTRYVPANQKIATGQIVVKTIRWIDS